jgi:hypothetical protein
MSWTGLRVFKHDGSHHHGVGIQPTDPARRALAGVRAGRDDVLERALALVRWRIGRQDRGGARISTRNRTHPLDFSN